MYFSKLLLEPDRETASFIGNPYKVHQELRKAVERPSKLLYRIEYSAKPEILVYTGTEPVWKADCTRWIREVFTKEYKPVIKTGDVFRFYLRANPTLTRDGKRVPLKRDESLHDWLKRKANKSGFVVSDRNFRTSNARNYNSYKKGEKRIIHYGVDIEGILQVVDKDIFIEVLRNGIGRGKGFGFGMLTIART